VITKLVFAAVVSEPPENPIPLRVTLPAGVPALAVFVFPLNVPVPEAVGATAGPTTKLVAAANFK
jgi:hypothetical protein